MSVVGQRGKHTLLVLRRNSGEGEVGTVDRNISVFLLVILVNCIILLAHGTWTAHRKETRICVPVDRDNATIQDPLSAQAMSDYLLPRDLELPR